MFRLAASVRVRVTAAVVLVFGAFLAVGAFGLVRQVSSALINDIQVRNDTVTQALSQVLATGQVTPQSLAAPGGGFSTPLGESYDPEVVREGILGSYIFTTGPAADSGADDPNGLWARVQSLLSKSATPLFGKVVPADLPADEFVVSRARIQTPRGALELHVASPLGDVVRTVSRLSNALWVAGPALVAMVGILTWLMAGRALQPVHSITSRVKEITGTTLHERVPEPRSGDEVGELARTMNAMLDRLEVSSARQKQFMSDASHELRSPVASIRTQLETALLAGDSTDWARVARTVLHEDARLGSLVDNMLALARLEEGVRQAAGEVDLDDVVFEQTSRPTRVTVDRSRVGAGRVLGVPTELASVVRNLFDNAARHAQSMVAISLTTSGPWVRLTVADDGPGVALADRDTVFQRFARLQEGRARDSGGSGLGLALSRQIVETTGGRIFVETSELGGAAFVVELPAAVSQDDADRHAHV